HKYGDAISFWAKLDAIKFKDWAFAKEFNIAINELEKWLVHVFDFAEVDWATENSGTFSSSNNYLQISTEGFQTLDDSIGVEDTSDRERRRGVWQAATLNGP
ncbi:Hypothetical protein CINCED_3A000089, partial [Cinara cedri]